MQDLQHFLFRKLMNLNHLSGSKRKNCRVNAKSLLGILSLGIVGGTGIRIIADGSDEQQAVESLVELVESGFSNEK